MRDMQGAQRVQDFARGVNAIEPKDNQMTHDLDSATMEVL